MGAAYRGYHNGSIPLLGGFVAGPKTALAYPMTTAVACGAERLLDASPF